MSAVLVKTQQLYRQAFKIEMLLVGIVGGVGILFGVFPWLSLLCGILVALLPHWIFVYWIFFRHTQENYNPRNMKSFYLGEVLKWAITVILMIVIFVSFNTLILFAFFSGYFFTLATNSLLPMLLTLRKK